MPTSEDTFVNLGRREIALVSAGRISAHVEKFSLSDAGAAYNKLRAGKIDGRAVVVPAA